MQTREISRTGESAAPTQPCCKLPGLRERQELPGESCGHRGVGRGLTTPPHPVPQNADVVSRRRVLGPPSWNRRALGARPGNQRLLEVSQHRAVTV